MTDGELKELYTLCCDTKGYDPDPGQFKTWKAVLGWSDARDLEKAIAEHYSTSLTLPMPAELKPLIEAARRKRMLPTTGYEYMTGYRCPRCFTTMTSFSEAREVRCEACWKAGKHVLISVQMQERKLRGTDNWERVGAAPDPMVENDLPEYLRSGRDGAE